MLVVIILWLHESKLQYIYMREFADFVVIGAGIAGASVAYWLAPHGKVAVLEQESQPGYHSTGRSAALYMASYGSEQVRALTLASRSFFDAPPAGFSSHALLTPRGALMVATQEQLGSLEAHWAILQSMHTGAQRLSAAQACALVPALRPEAIAGAVLEPDASDMDVHAIHQGFLRGLKNYDGQVYTDARVIGLHRENNEWLVQTPNRIWRTPIVINAAGAWADHVGTLAGAQSIGLTPCRRSAFTFKPETECDFSHWPMTYGASEDWYIKPDAGLMLGSPANADPVEPHDVRPEELDIATAIYRIEEMTTLTIRRPSHTWAGLRSFVDDHSLVGGYDMQAKGFFWVAAQGGYGIQTSPAMGESCASLIRGLGIPEHIASWGLTAEMLSPARLI